MRRRTINVPLREDLHLILRFSASAYRTTLQDLLELTVTLGLGVLLTNADVHPDLELGRQRLQWAEQVLTKLRQGFPAAMPTIEEILLSEEDDAAGETAR